jgi:6-pyruvoyltetrahydropterin/6-carboxytetrahydropterin synthase
LHKVKLYESPNNSCEVYASGATADNFVIPAQLPELVAA